MTFSLKTGVALAALAVFAAGVSVPVRPAEAQTLLERIFKGPEQRRREREAAFRAQQLEGERQQIEAQQSASPKPVIRVAGPSYFTYKPDRLVVVDFARIADPVITGALTVNGFPALGLDPFAEGRAALQDLKLRALEDVAAAVIEQYSTYPAYLWVAGTGVTESARSVLAVLADAESVGLSPADYAVLLPSEAFDVARGGERQKELMRFEMALSVAVASYILDADRGRVDPNRISGYHDFKRKSPDVVSSLRSVATAPDAGVALLAQNPKGAHFAALVAGLKALQAAQEGARIVIAEGLLLKPGQINPELANVMAAIALRGSDALKVDHALLLASYAGKPDYDEELVDLVKAFQKENGLSADGVIGAMTVRKLVGVSNAEKIEKIHVALEQARWLPGEFAGRRVFINQPAFTATYYNDGKPELAMRVVVGTKANQTNFFDDEIETVEFNPYWGVPQSILINEMLPKLRRDPSYLDRLGYEVVSGGKAVSSSAINWNAVGKGSGIGVRQPPSGDNALGELKILFPNTHAIYMHDTPSKSLFAKDMRAFSHGCVRLQDPRAMAAAVLGTTVEDIGRQIAGGANKAVSVPTRIAVHVAYFTAWPNEAGEVEFFDDVYGRDSFVRKALDATTAVRQQQS